MRAPADGRRHEPANTDLLTTILHSNLGMSRLRHSDARWTSVKHRLFTTGLRPHQTYPMAPSSMSHAPGMRWSGTRSCATSTCPAIFGPAETLENGAHRRLMRFEAPS